SACSGKLSNASTDLLCDLVRLTVAVDRDDAVEEHRRKFAVGAIDGAVKVLPLAFDPVGQPCACSSGCRIDEDEERPVGEQPADRVFVQLQNALDTESARDSLVGERGIDVAVADD